MSDEKCTKCNKTLEGMISCYGEKSYHPECFVCHLCKEPLSGEIRDHLEGIAHVRCFEQQQGFGSGEGNMRIYSIF